MLLPNLVKKNVQLFSQFEMCAGIQTAFWWSGELQLGKWVKKTRLRTLCGKLHVEQNELLELHGEVESSPLKWDLDIDVRYGGLAADIGHSLQVKSLHDTPFLSCSKLQTAGPICLVFICCSTVCRNLSSAAYTVKHNHHLQPSGHDMYRRVVTICTAQ